VLVFCYKMDKELTGLFVNNSCRRTEKFLRKK